ncbi:cytidine deaminase [uncultured Clostridium sp.]|uniref:cytidine deaminase n=1 Tax=uncultured Clostridium sp. TaxID=59620 RepID=UPI0026201A63|nr:cytidine deaminase [uncultured Clostridium sp.]
MKEKLIKMAIEAREKAYCPYSDFKVGAAALFEDGNVYTGCNIENASYGATNCAERTAIFNGVATGARTLEAIALIGDVNNFTYPCGICRQVMVEFARDNNMKIYIVKSENEYIETTIGEIVPGAFTGKDLKK